MAYFERKPWNVLPTKIIYFIVVMSVAKIVERLPLSITDERLPLSITDERLPLSITDVIYFVAKPSTVDISAWRTWRRPPTSSLLLDWSCRRTRRRRRRRSPRKYMVYTNQVRYTRENVFGDAINVWIDKNTKQGSEWVWLFTWCPTRGSLSPFLFSM